VFVLSAEHSRRGSKVDAPSPSDSLMRIRWDTGRTASRPPLPRRLPLRWRHLKSRTYITLSYSAAGQRTPQVLVHWACRHESAPVSSPVRGMTAVRSAARSPSRRNRWIVEDLNCWFGQSA
jgi:hypothetical protein